MGCLLCTGTKQLHPSVRPRGAGTLDAATIQIQGDEEGDTTEDEGDTHREGETEKSIHAQRVHFLMKVTKYIREGLSWTL